MNVQLQPLPGTLSEPDKARMRDDVRRFQESGAWKYLYTALATYSRDELVNGPLRDIGRTAEPDALIVRRGAVANGQIDMVELLLSPMMGLEEILKPVEPRSEQA